ncbi:MAG: dTMP kinase [Verrucomicrobiota bacterium]|nr:MAG: dTMP kinase [Verrucomicrobiota bacterium]
MRGEIISFEGIEGTGKSTQIQYLQQFLADQNIEAQAVREPGNTYIGERIRALLQNDAAADNMCPETELLLYEASRAQLIREFVAPRIEQGQWVIFDRFFDSSVAYQGAARGLSTEIVQMLNDFAVQNYRPRLTFLLDIDIDTAFQRLQQRQTAKDRIEQESSDFFEKARQKYLEMATAEPKRFVILDGKLSSEDLAAIIREHVQKIFHF